MRKLLAHLVAALLAMALIASTAVAQTQQGTISGSVTDPSGAAVAGAKVTLTNTATNISESTTTNQSGGYVLANVTPGSYKVTIEKQGFKKSEQNVTVGVAQRLAADFDLQVGQVTETVTVEATAERINTVTGSLAEQISSQELMNLPLITRNPYALVALAPTAADTGRVTGDTRGAGGLAVGGSRTSSINFMLDGGENNDTFVAGVGQSVPLDAVQEFIVQTNNVTAEFGRNAIVTNVVTKGGTNRLHGSAYDFYRGASLTSRSVEDNANDTPKANFVRNQFGGSIGGPIIKDKTFFFGSFEGIRVRSSFNERFFVPTAAFLTAASPETNNFISTFGGLPSSNCGDLALTAQQIVEDVEGTGTYAGNELFDQGGVIIPAATQLFCRTTLRRPSDSGGGSPQDTYQFTARIDHRFSDKTGMSARYAFDQSTFFPGSVSFSPYAGFNTGQQNRNQNANFTLTRSWSPRVFSETRLIYNRVNVLQPLGEAPATAPCWNYDFNFNTPTGDQIVFPGYVPDVCIFAGIPFGGPQNTYQAYTGFTWSHGKHTFKFGGGYQHLRDNRNFGAFENGFFDNFNLQSMIDGGVDFIFVAIDPKGKTVGQVYDTAVDGPFAPPLFGRHFHYNEFSLYGEDQIKLTRHFTLTLGLRWEYFGVLHSPNEEKFLDANLFLDAVGVIGPGKSKFESIRDARFQRTDNLFQRDFNNFAPRVGFAWDIFGNSRTVLRGGYGLFYDRNFGNAVFNAIQNPPNYAVISLVPFGSLPIEPNQFDTLNAGGATLTISSSARMLDRKMVTAYSAQWNATLEHDILGKGVIASVSYVGSNGYKLYSLNNLNQRGACLLLDPALLPLGCNPAGGASSRLNQTGLTGMNRRANEGFSRYNALATEIRTGQLGATGLNLKGSYAWAHSIDNSSSFFADSIFEAFFGFGFKDPFNPAGDRASSTNDIRHRGTISGTWAIPWAKGQKGLAGQILDGWTINGIFVSQTGGAFSVYDGSSSQCNNSGTNFCYPVQLGAVPGRTDTATGVPNRLALFTIPGTTYQTQEDFCAGSLACTASLYVLTPELLARRNEFRTPGFYNLDFSILKDFKLPREGMKLQFRAEAFNILNHSNLYVLPGTNQFAGGPSTVEGARGLFPGGGAERRNIQLAVRLVW